jgi:hypothetical protein
VPPISTGCEAALARSRSQPGQITVCLSYDEAGPEYSKGPEGFMGVMALQLLSIAPRLDEPAGSLSPDSSCAVTIQKAEEQPDGGLTGILFEQLAYLIHYADRGLLQPGQHQAFQLFARFASPAKARSRASTSLSSNAAKTGVPP